MIDGIERVQKIIKTVQEMSGGRRSGIIVFWVAFILAVCIALKPAYDSVAYVVNQFSGNTLVMNIFVLLITGIAMTLVMIGIGFGLGALLGISVRIALSQVINVRIDRILSDIKILLDEISKMGNNSEKLSKLTNDANDIYTRWNQSRITKFIRWWTPKKVESQKVKKNEL